MGKLLLILLVSIASTQAFAAKNIVVSSGELRILTADGFLAEGIVVMHRVVGENTWDRCVENLLKLAGQTDKNGIIHLESETFGPKGFGAIFCKPFRYRIREWRLSAGWYEFLQLNAKNSHISFAPECRYTSRDSRFNFPNEIVTCHLEQTAAEVSEQYELLKHNVNNLHTIVLPELSKIPQPIFHPSNTLDEPLP